MQQTSPIVREVTHGHVFCGLGAGAKGFNMGEARVGRLQATFRCVGGIDNDPAAIADFGRLAGVPGTCRDLFSRDQYIAFFGKEPPPGWVEAVPEEMLELEGLSDSAWRERIGNAVPPPAAAAIASVMGRTLLMAWSGQTFMLSSEPIWVQPIAMALAVQTEQVPQ